MKRGGSRFRYSGVAGGLPVAAADNIPLEPRDPLLSLKLSAVLAAGVVVVASSGFGALREAPAATPMRTVRTLTITATNYAFDAPDTVAAGPTAITLKNRGTELHHVWLVRFEKGHTLAEYMAAFKADGHRPLWSHDVGGPNAAIPGADATTIVNLPAGTYMVLCFIPASDGVGHVMKGMSRQIVAVTRPTASGNRMTVADPDVTLTLTDYAFTLSKPLTAGRHVIRIRNRATQPHEFVLAQLAPGRTVADLAQWVDKMEGPPPGAPFGGTSGLEPGAANELIVDLAPGAYGFLCFVSDVKDGKPHVAHGMLRQITVPPAVAHS